MSQDRSISTPGYWENRYQTQDTPWDIGHASPPLIHYLEHLQDYKCRILIPGAGKAHEALWLHRRGFSEVYVCDWAPSAFDRLRQEEPAFPEAHLLVEDFFQLAGTFDLILEQTFFSAIQLPQRQAYAQKAQALLQPQGKLVGVLFAHPFDHQGPPFGGTAEEYEALFAPYFDIQRMHTAVDSVSPRAGRELFMELRAKVI